jgi:hypothetical protein
VHVANRIQVRTSLLAAAVYAYMAVRSAAVVVVAALVVVPPALADYAMTVRKTHVQQGERMTIWGNGCHHSTRSSLGMPVYLVPERHQRTTVYKPRPPSGPPYRFLGRFRCTHTHLPQPWGDGGYWTSTVKFRLPRVTPGRYQLVLYCASCHKGLGGNLVLNNWYFDGKRRYGLDALMVARR